MAKLDIKNLPMPVRIVIAAVPPILFILVFGYFSILPKFKQINTLKTSISEQEKKIADGQGTDEQLSKLKVENQKLKERLLELAKQLPEEKEISILLNNISELGKEAGLDISAWKPSEKKDHSSKIVYQVPFSVDFTGSYHRLGVFFSSLTRLDRIVNISKIDLKTPKIEGGEAILKVSFSALTFTAAVDITNATAVGSVAPAGGATTAPPAGGPSR